MDRVALKSFVDRRTLKERAIENWRDPAYREKLRISRRRAYERIKAGEGFIYLAEVIGTETIKIGHALDLAVRAKSIKADHGVDVRMIASIPGSRSTERSLHWRLRRHRDKGPVKGCATEFYHRSVLSHPAIPDGLRVAP